MPDYLPLYAFRQELLPVTCRSCAWWQTTGSPRADTEAASQTRRQWVTAVESTWGSTGLLLANSRPSVGTGWSRRSPNPEVVASVHYAPAAAMPRLRDLPLASLPADAVVVFCLRSEGDQAHSQGKRLLQKALGELRQRGVTEVYALARVSGGPRDGDRCEFFSLDFLETSGFECVKDDGKTFVMRADLRGLLSLFTKVEAAVRRVLGNDPAPSPAALARRGTS